MSSGAGPDSPLKALERELLRLGLALGSFRQAEAEELGLVVSDLDVLALLEDGPRTAGQLAEATLLTTGAVTAVLDRLERAGYVRRGRDPQDRRRVVVEFVAERADRLERASEPLKRVAADLTSGWSPPEVERLTGFLGDAARRLHDDAGRRRAPAAPDPAGSSGEFSAPLAGVERARLELLGGTASLTVTVDPGMDELFRARFEGRPPRVRIEAGRVTVSYARLKLLDFRHTSGRVALNPAARWELEASGGHGAMLHFDLTGLPLASLAITHGASDIRVALPRPEGPVRVQVAGGASVVRFERPRGVAARLRVTGGASVVTFDAQTVAAVGGDTVLESASYSGSADRYEIDIAGGTSAITVSEA